MNMDGLHVVGYLHECLRNVIYNSKLLIPPKLSDYYTSTNNNVMYNYVCGLSAGESQSLEDRC